MKQVVYKSLNNKNYIIVLDDVWKVNVWEAIRYIFPRSGSYGCIIITTRFHNIGHPASVETNGYLYNIQPLSLEESIKLFYKNAFLGSSHCCPTHLEKVAEIILKRCEGLPLAIVVIGRLLATKDNNFVEWIKFQESLGAELEGNQLRRITKLISRSYYDLPYYLKSCFMYLSIFPEDHFILSTTLILMWIAEGFVQPNWNSTLEEVGLEYIEELVNRSLIQVAETTGDGKPLTLRVHDLFHKFILSKAREQGFVTIADGRDSSRWFDRSRRLVIHNNTIKDTCKNFDHLRSVIVLDFVGAFSNKLLSKLLGGSRLLRVLEPRDPSLENIPRDVFKLRHLKYLNMEGTKVKIVPKSISKLKNLETLNLNNTNVTELPNQVLRLKQLRHLMVFTYEFDRGYPTFQNKQSFKVPYRIGCLSSLQTISDIEPGDVDGSTTIVREIGKLTELRSLSLMKLREQDGEHLCSSLANLRSLHSLYIGSMAEDEIMDLLYPFSPIPPLQTLELRGRLQKIPQWIPSLHGLTICHLKYSRIKDDPLESLQNLPSLVELELYHAYVGEGLCFIVSTFPRLNKLSMLRLEGLRWVKVEEGSMPLLKELSISDCKLMMEVPSGIEHLTKLQHINFSDMAEGFVETLDSQNIGNRGRMQFTSKD